MTREIPLTQGKVARVSDHRYDELMKWKWCAHKEGNTFYAVRNYKNGSKHGMIKMHTQITGYAMTDHIDGDGLNNDDGNMRECTKSENAMNSKKRIDNTSGYRGVSLDKPSGKWKSYIVINNKYNHLGYFLTAEESARAYNKAAVELFGEFAFLNDV